MPLITANDFINRRADGFDAEYHFSLESPVASTNVYTRTGVIQMHRVGTGIMAKMPSSLPSGVVSFKPLSITLTSSIAAGYMVARLTNLGSVNLATNVFTAGSVMPTRLEGNTSRQIWSGILLETLTGFNATPGTMVITYLDDSGNSAEAAASITLTASSVAGSMQFLTLNGTDLGAFQVTNMVRSGGTSPTGVLGAWGVECIDLIPTPTATQPEISNLLTSFPFTKPLGINEELVLISVGNVATKSVIGKTYFIGETA